MNSRAGKTPPTSPGKRVDSKTRRRLIREAAAKLFARSPYDQVTTKQLAEAAGISEALLFQHFGSKRDLYIEVVRAGVEDFAAAFHQIVAAVVELPEATVERIEEMFRATLDYYFANPGLLRSFFTEPDAEEVRRTYYQVMIEAETATLDSLEKARRRGMLPDVDPRVLLRALVGQPLVFLVTEEWLGGKELGSLNRETLPGELARLWAGILGAAPAAGSGKRKRKRAGTGGTT